MVWKKRAHHISCNDANVAHCECGVDPTRERFSFVHVRTVALTAAKEHEGIVAGLLQAV